MSIEECAPEGRHRMNRAAVLLVEEFATTVVPAPRNERRYLKDATLCVHNGRAWRGSQVLQRECDYVRVVQATADALNVGRHQVSGYEFAVGRAFVTGAYAPFEAELCARL